MHNSHSEAGDEVVGQVLPPLEVEMFRLEEKKPKNPKDMQMCGNTTSIVERVNYAPLCLALQCTQLPLNIFR